MIAATGISLDVTKKELETGKTFSLKATITPSNATNKNITWKSSNNAVAKVDSSGKVTAVSVGTAVISAKIANGKTATCSITVSAIKENVAIVAEDQYAEEVVVLMTEDQYTEDEAVVLLLD